MANFDTNNQKWKPSYRVVYYLNLITLLIDGSILGVLIAILNVFNINGWFQMMVLIFFVAGYIFEAFLNQNYYQTAQIKELAKKQSFELTRGRFISKKTYIPFDKIYGVSEKTNIIQNLFHIYDLEIQTAAKQYVFHGLIREDLERIINNYYLLEENV
ncbi:putative membrane protein YdbT with pleckstrin-like domain [Weissella uvarum]|nr:PH domain-containing protein [Weissella uvarum]MBM7616905.1 putative membrane protein YdbT with pleckstrin-like domain [Weissella uvarum]